MRGLEWFGITLAAAALIVALMGCAVDPALIEALSKDQATACITVSAVWGTASIARSNITNGDVKCGALEVHSPGQVNVPVSVRAIPGQ